MNPRAKKFLSYYKPYRKLFLADMLCAITAAGISLVYPLIVRYITQDVLVNNEINQAIQIIIRTAVLLVGLALLEFGCNFFIAYKGHIMGAKMEFDMRNEIFGHFQKLSFNFYDNQKTGQLMTRITNDLFDITELCHHGPEDIVISIIKFVGAFIILVRINWKLTIILFLFIPMMFIFAYIMKGRMNRAFRKNRERIADINAQIEDNLSGIRVVKSFANEECEISKFEEGNRRFVDSKSHAYWQMATFHSGLSMFTNLINVSVIVGGGVLIALSGILLSDMLTFMLYVNNIIEPIRKLINFTEQFQNGITGFSRFMEILETNPDIVDSKDAKELKNVRGDISFEDVSFKYQDTTSEVFRNINLQVPAGEYLALVGSSGVGKTTMCSLIPRFYEVSSGRITIDGQDIRNLTQKSLRKNIGIVQQDVYLFAGTVADNIRYGDLNATMEEVIEAAKNANAHEFIMNLPEGYNTYIGQRGVKLSGGQKQRLSIARVFLKNPPILIFDEATSALDNESEKIVQESLEKLAKNRTTFVIAHRLSTIKNARNIIVLTEEGIKEQGTHEKLLSLDGIYASLYHLTYERQEA
ncbi:ABC transporter ATP-binding protein [Lachnoclostridium sp.]|uniref:ABC transporter ATP-binding protein n=1 Tax=Lachnoclostridium sp. TaxID=2028282 RepID=UPI002898E375|nr:ABC transporter ATP-binding protein [Lachnoclostridium sp.]